MSHVSLLGGRGQQDIEREDSEFEANIFNFTDCFVFRPRILGTFKSVALVSKNSGNLGWSP